MASVGCLVLVPSEPHRPNLLPLQKPSSALSPSLSLLFPIVFYPTITLSVEVSLYRPTPLLGGRTGDLTSIIQPLGPLTHIFLTATFTIIIHYPRPPATPPLN